MRRKFTYEEAIQAFWNKIDKRGPTECWPWMGARITGGYGCLGIHSHIVYAHRLAYELAKGPIPKGLHIDHLCRNRDCVNPDHMEAVTNRTNTLRGNGKTAANAAKTICKRGHPLDESNTYIRPNGYRNCHECRRLRSSGLI